MTFSFPGVYKTDNRFITYGTSVSYSIGLLLLLPVKSDMVYKHHNYKHHNYIDYKIFVIVASRLLSVIMIVATIGIKLHGQSIVLNE